MSENQPSKGFASALSLAGVLAGLWLQSKPTSAAAIAVNQVLPAIPEIMITGGAFYASISSPIKAIRKLIPWKK